MKNYLRWQYCVKNSLTTVRLNALQCGPEGVSEANQMLIYTM